MATVSSDSTQNSQPDSDPSPGVAPISNPTQASPSMSIHLSFNQDYGCFSACTDYGFLVFDTDPFRLVLRRDFGPQGGLGLACMLFRFNLFCLVGGGSAPLSPSTKVLLWDDHVSRCVGELSFRSQIRSLRLRRDRIVVILLQKVYVYNFADLRLLQQVETVSNPKGLCEVSQVSGPMVMVCPGQQKGEVRVEDFGSGRIKLINAHSSTISCLALTHDGRFMATASSKGTLIRVFNTLDGTLLKEVRRGADRAEIYSLAFSSTAQWLAAASDKGTVHVFSLNVDSVSLEDDRTYNASESNLSNKSAMSTFSLLKGVLPRYFNSEWSVAKFRLPEGLQHLVAFGKQKNTVVIIGMDGSFYRCKFDPLNGGEMTQLEHYNFLKPEENFINQIKDC